ncbi:winged helix-turn-helix domain-containing protein [Pseudomonas sp. CCI3.2]|uniref:winged helix-turn-helix domain-containing protein n=1 Tax=unclassified Pseudomonas TaxID=196821 RepID=UPI002AC994DB|nr:MULTISPECIES: winged helix-turn-helix domain-containing protein [unclassified Pseudomonas]MEB0075980.1 winged helix-turn-helix domain-containing protein [Pseudomonas sp. MH10out]MEB0101425.1 winged helix-turn-helix domain-containing protein [Pseudomonas sp. CCI3.2]MEB0130959.1 winged helix-turn-helix domain-containing protein [Pseudomonas sp. CCI2.4]MEB0157937.1 winged helix-turn-helix domain-containing protein [Pseudomonas sp. AH2 (2023)]MEB0166358.1 winged helix-turn-helix domain-containi
MSAELSLKQARRLALAAQGFTGRQPPASIKATHVSQLIERLGILQIDSVNALVRSHYLPLFSRLGNYAQPLLDQAAWSQGRQRKLFEYWGHEASLLPLSLYPLLRWRMRQASQGVGIYQQMAKFGREQQATIAKVLQTVREQGALGAGSLSTRQERAGPWWDWSAEKHALEWLFAAGEVTVSGRRGFERLYDVPERVLPAATLDHPDISEGEAQRGLLLHAATALGVGTDKDLRDYFRLAPAQSRSGLAQLVEAGALQMVQVQGWRQPAYCLPEQKLPRKVSASALLSPFDSLIWERSRTERLFDFRYRLEIYTPQDKRVYGYYVLPFLHNERIAARVDLRAERVLGRLAVHAVHEEEKGLDEEGMLALAKNLRQMADWLGLAQVQINCQRASAARLRVAFLSLL